MLIWRILKKVEVNRKFGVMHGFVIFSGVLKVGRETKDGFPISALSSQSEIPDLSAPQYFFGGLSPGFEPQIELPQSFLGCMSDLQISPETYNPFKGRNWGVQRTCSEKVSDCK